MSRQVIAQEWKIIETLFDIGTNDFYTKTRRIGNCTKATALKRPVKFSTTIHGEMSHHMGLVVTGSMQMATPLNWFLPLR